MQLLQVGNAYEHFSTSLAVLHLHPDHISALVTRSTKEQAPNIVQGYKASPCNSLRLVVHTSLLYATTLWPEILAGNVFWRIGGFESNPH